MSTNHTVITQTIANGQMPDCAPATSRLRPIAALRLDATTGALEPATPFHGAAAGSWVAAAASVSTETRPGTTATSPPT